MTREQAMELIHRQWADKEAKRAPARARVRLQRERANLYPELVDVCRMMVRVLDRYGKDAPQGELGLMKLVLVKAEAIEKEAQS